MTFSFIIPTLGRRSLGKTLRSFADDLRPRDEVIVIADGAQAYHLAKSIISKESSVCATYKTLCTKRTRGCGGAPQRNLGIEAASGEWLLFMDDDDKYLPGGVSKVREALDGAEYYPHMFRMRHARDWIWTDKEVRHKNVSTHMFVVPNINPMLGKWEGMKETGTASDFVFIQRTLDNWRGVLVWREEKIAQLMRHSRWKEPK